MATVSHEELIYLIRNNRDWREKGQRVPEKGIVISFDSLPDGSDNEIYDMELANRTIVYKALKNNVILMFDDFGFLEGIEILGTNT
jgi:hypothetical protein